MNKNIEIECKNEECKFKGIYKIENVVPGTVMGNICLECGKPSFIHFDNNCNVLKISKTREI